MEEKKFIGMGNDYMFRAVLQKSDKILKHLLATLLELDMSEIDSCVILNPIELGSSIDAKDCVLDIKLYLNDRSIINIELQMYFEEFWVPRSLLYWARAYDSLKEGEGYELLKPTCHIGILNHTLFKDHPEFYADYKILNSKNHFPYGDFLNIKVLDLSLLDSLSDADACENPKLVRWARIFKAETMQEIEALTKGEEALENMELILAQMSEDEKIREQCFAREDYERRMSSMHASGFNQGLVQGISQGRIAQLVDLVNDGLLSLANAASSANMSEENFSKFL